MEKEKTIYNTTNKIVIIIADPIGILKLSSKGSGKVSKCIAYKLQNLKCKMAMGRNNMPLLNIQ